MVAAVRFTVVTIGGAEGALLLGPLAVDPEFAGKGHGRQLVGEAMELARADGLRLVVLVGDEPYYARFGFHPVPPGQITLPGPVDPKRLLAAELEPGALARRSGGLIIAKRAVITNTAPRHKLREAHQAEGSIMDRRTLLAGGGTLLVATALTRDAEARASSVPAHARGLALHAARHRSGQETATIPSAPSSCATARCWRSVATAPNAVTTRRRTPRWSPSAPSSTGTSPKTSRRPTHLRLGRAVPDVHGGDHLVRL